MIEGIGCDIVKIARIARLLERHEHHFLNKVFTTKEICLAQGVYSKPNYFAKRFAAKEAYAKAMGLGISKSIGFKQIEILNNANKAPFFSLHPFMKKSTTFLSLADDGEYAMAYVICTSKT